MTSAFIMTFDQIEGDPAEAYDASAADFDAMDAKVRSDGRVHDEGVHHVNGVDADGHAVVIDSWTSKAARDAFLAEHVFPNAPADAPPPQIEDLELHNWLA